MSFIYSHALQRSVDYYQASIDAVDAGRWGTKWQKHTGETGHFESFITDYIKQKSKQDQEGIMVLEYPADGAKKIMGPLAEFEGMVPGFKPTITKKSVKETLYLTLGALWQMGYREPESDHIIGTGIPIDLYDEEDDTEIQALKKLLIGEHLVYMNGERFKYIIHDAKVTVEGGAVFLADPRRKAINEAKKRGVNIMREFTTRIVDPGAFTVNCATFNGLRYNNSQSFTLPQGWDSLKGIKDTTFATKILAQVSQIWNPQDYVLVSGGKPDPIIQVFKRHFEKVHIAPDPQYANVRGYYVFAKSQVKKQLMGT
jgi:hypothetical protein